jgi:hypothetical protein
LMGFWWMVSHGVGFAMVIPFLPIGIELGVLWWTFRHVNRSTDRRAPVVIAVVAIAFLLLNEAVAPSTPLNRSRRQRAMEAITVRSVHDDVLLSAKGNPIGVLITYEVLFPRRVVAFPYLDVARIEDPAYPHLDATGFWGPTDTIDPEPTTSGSIYRVFESGRVYTFTARRLPGFLAYDEKTQQPCLRAPVSSPVSETDRAPAIGKRGGVKYNLTISWNNEVALDEGYHSSHATSREYDLGAMYQTIVKEGNQRCSP